ncbi:MAG: translocation/assembly module TamB domain-containing protein [Erythrobacter sp.]|nr:translocation/assembly module TamB domain-containing protein [Erythrobacter sp.]
MTDDIELESAPKESPDRTRKRHWAKRLGWAILILALPLILVTAFFGSPIGKRFIADQIADVAPASGLRFEVGRIEGDVFDTAVLHDVVVLDPEGEFLTIPEVTLEWRPLSWLWSGIDIREIAARRGRMSRLPELLPGDPDAPLLPEFDIRVDSLEIDNLVLAEGLATDGAQRVDLSGKLDIRSGRALIDVDGSLGAEDRISLLLDAEPDGDRFDLELDYVAPAGGVIAGLTGLGAGYEAKVVGDGAWSDWLGHALVTRYPPTIEEGGGERVAAFQLTNRAGTYGLLGQINPTIDDGGLLDRTLGDGLSLALIGTLEESVFDGRAAAVTSAVDARGTGSVDLARNAFEGFDLAVAMRDPALLGGGVRLADARFDGTLDGAFGSLSIRHRLTTSELAIGAIAIEGLAQSSTARWEDGVLSVPLQAGAARVKTGVDLLDAQLIGGALTGTLRLADRKLTSDDARIAFPGLVTDLVLRGDTATGAYALAGPLKASGLDIDGIGKADGNAKLIAKFGTRIPWSLRANVAGVLTDIRNQNVATVAGSPLRFRGAFGMGGDQPIILRNVELESEVLRASLDSEVRGATTTIAGGGRHVDFGPFTADASISAEGPRATLVFADPVPEAGLTDVRLALVPSAEGFDLDVAGGSPLGSFEGALGLALPANAPTRIDIERLSVFRTDVTGALTLRDSGVAGDLALTGGGLEGTLALDPVGSGVQGFDLSAKATRASFDGPTPLRLEGADIYARGSLGNGTSEIFADVSGTGLEYGGLSVAHFAAKAAIEDGSGSVLGSIAGRRTDRFALKFDGDIAPERIALLARGEFAGRRIAMPRRALLTPLDGGGYRLAPTQIGFAEGFAIVEGRLGGGETALEARLAEMPLRLADLAAGDLGLGGRLSGIVNYRQAASGPPSGEARVRIDGFSRAGLVLSSKPIDVLGVIELGGDRLTAGARLSEGGSRVGRLDARITGLGRGNDLASQVIRGRLDATLAYDGAAESLWRLVGIETFDLTGPLALTAQATGSLGNPRLSGSLASDGLRLQSAITGTDIAEITARGQFAGSRLQLIRFAGTPRGGGSVSGSGTIDLAGMGASRGPRIDIRAAVDRAQILNTAGLDATITGPLRIVSNGSGGTIAGKVRINRAFWQLGTAAEDMSLPRVATREINRTSGAATRTDAPSSWRYLVNANAPRRIEVDGLGLDSEWAADIVLRGTVDDPRVGGEARLVRGDYTFAGARFELTRGRIGFDASSPIDPRLDIAAETARAGTDVTVTITGRSQAPSVALSSDPELPDEEILAQLLFGGSVTTLSATDAVQLAAALAALQGGGGLDPIGNLRRSIGLDQLRIVAADPAIGQSTGVALGKYLGRRVYVELVTDGQGYSATQLEYRVTSWLALLGTVSTIGRDSVLAEISRDY